MKNASFICLFENGPKSIFCISIYLSICLSVYLLSVCLSVYISKRSVVTTHVQYQKIYIFHNFFMLLKRTLSFRVTICSLSHAINSRQIYLWNVGVQLHL